MQVFFVMYSDGKICLERITKNEAGKDLCLGGSGHARLTLHPVIKKCEREDKGRGERKRGKYK